MFRGGNPNPFTSKESGKKPQGQSVEKKPLELLSQLESERQKEGKTYLTDQELLQLTFKDYEGKERNIFMEALQLMEKEEVVKDDILYSLGLEELERELRQSGKPLSLEEISTRIIDKIAGREELTEDQKQKLEDLKSNLKDVKSLQDALEKLGQVELFQEKGLSADRILNIGGVVYIPDDYEIIAVTDLHGDIEMLERAIMVFEEKKQRNTQAKVAFVVMGDFVDRGEYSGEVILRLLELKRRYQEEVVIMAGDHERSFKEFSDQQGKTTRYVPDFQPREFWDKCFSQDPEIKKQTFELFLNLPHLVVVDKNTIITHGGLTDVENIGNLMYFPKEEPLREFYQEGKPVVEPKKLGGTQPGEEVREWGNLLEIILWADFLSSRRLEAIIIKPEEFEERARNLLGLSEEESVTVIRGHQYDILPEEDKAYDSHPTPSGSRIITFHSNQSYYATQEKAYQNGVIVEIKKEDNEIKINPVGYDELENAAQDYKEKLDKLNQQLQTSNLPSELSPMFSLLTRNLASRYKERASDVLSEIINKIKVYYEQQEFPLGTLSKILDAVYSARNPELMLSIIYRFIDAIQGKTMEVLEGLPEWQKFTEEEKNELLPRIESELNSPTILEQNLDALRENCNQIDKKFEKPKEKDEAIDQLIEDTIPQITQNLEGAIKGIIQGGVILPTRELAEGRKFEIPSDLSIENLKTLESQVLGKCSEGIMRCRELLERIYHLKLPRGLLKILRMENKKERIKYIKNKIDTPDRELLQKIIEIENQIYDVIEEITTINNTLKKLQKERGELESSRNELKEGEKEKLEKIKETTERLYKELIVLKELAEKHLKTIEELEQAVKKLEDTYGTTYKPPSSAERRKTLENIKQILAVGGWVILLSVMLWPVYLGIFLPLELIERSQKLFKQH